jgi:hypothetical protein
MGIKMSLHAPANRSHHAWVAGKIEAISDGRVVMPPDIRWKLAGTANLLQLCVSPTTIDGQPHELASTRAAPGLPMSGMLTTGA